MDSVNGLQNQRLFATPFIVIMFMGVLIISAASYSLTNRITIGSSGQISFTEMTARSGAARDIKAAVDAAAAFGGVSRVHIPPGNFNFVEIGEPWMTVEIPAGVSVVGETAELDEKGQVIDWKTVLVMPYDAGDVVWFEVNGNGDPNEPFRFSYIKLLGYRYLNPDSTSGNRAMVINEVVDFRIDHCYFRDTTSGIWIGGQPNSNCRGVIDHCKFINTNGIPGATVVEATVGYGVGIGQSKSTRWEDDILKVVGNYNMYTVFIEDCYFEKWRHCIAANDGVHYVFRHCTINADFGFGSLDAHGTYQYVGTRAVEIYDNNFTNCIPGWGQKVMFFRGGGGTFFNNYIDSTYGAMIEFQNEGTVAKCWPNDVYIWSNTGTTTIAGGGPVEGVNYHLNALPGYVPYAYPHPLTLVP